MSNIAKGSVFNIKIDFEKSQGSYIYDKNTDKSYLDFFGMYASLPLGYNHKIFKTKEFLDDVIRTSHTKVTNCEFISQETEDFDKQFSELCGNGIFSNFHYCSTGALAVEAAIKTCLHYKKYHKPNILSFRNSFHGINSYGGFVTDRFVSSEPRLRGIPEVFSTKCSYDLVEIEEKLKSLENPITCVLVEPIQCTAGDIHHDPKFYKELRRLCNQYDVPLIFDEIQIGFGATGKLWFYQHLEILPDIVVFGKKTQVSGFMSNKKMNNIFNKKDVNRLEVTWNSNTLDMIRSKFIIKAYKEENILENVIGRGKQIKKYLSNIPQIERLRTSGLIVGFDLKDSKLRNQFIQDCRAKGLICNSTGIKSVRLRPNLAISSEDILMGCEIIKEVLTENRK